jgi:hypothetical protein
MWRSVAAWCAILLAETAHGVLRAVFLVPRLGVFRSNQIGVLTGSVLILGIAYLLVDWIGVHSRQGLMRVGVAWLALTVVFELCVGHYVFDRSWGSLGEDYDLSRGGLMSLGLVVMTLAPLLAARMRAKTAD